MNARPDELFPDPPRLYALLETLSEVVTLASPNRPRAFARALAAGEAWAVEANTQVATSAMESILIMDFDAGAPVGWGPAVPSALACARELLRELLGEWGLGGCLAAPIETWGEDEWLGRLTSATAGPAALEIDDRRWRELDWCGTRIAEAYYGHGRRGPEAGGDVSPPANADRDRFILEAYESGMPQKAIIAAAADRGWPITGGTIWYARNRAGIPARRRPRRG